MAKKKTNVGKLGALISALLGIVAIVMLFLPAVGVKDTDTTYTGLQITFGYKQSVPIIGNVTVFEFSFMNLLTYLLVIVGIVFSILSAMGKGSKFAAFIAAAAFVISGIFFFLSIQYAVPNSDAQNILGALGGNIKDSLALAYGAIISGVASLLAALGNLCKVLFK